MCLEKNNKVTFTGAGIFKPSYDDSVNMIH